MKDEGKMFERITSVSEIDETTVAGQYLIMAIAKITTESQTDKTPEEVLEQIGDLVADVYHK